MSVRGVCMAYLLSSAISCKWSITKKCGETKTEKEEEDEEEIETVKILRKMDEESMYKKVRRRIRN